MNMFSSDSIKLYEEMYSRWAKLKKEHRLMPCDEPPDAKAMGLDYWVAEKIRQRVDREINRSFC